MPGSLDRDGVTHRFVISGHEGYVTVATDAAGRAELLELRVAKAGSTIHGLLACLGEAVSLGLERGIALEEFVELFSHVQFEPSGWTKGEEGYAHSLVDYVFRWAGRRFPDTDPQAVEPALAVSGETCSVCEAPRTWADGEACPTCGAVALAAAAGSAGAEPAADS